MKTHNVKAHSGKTYNVERYYFCGWKNINSAPMTYEACEALVGMLGLKDNYWIVEG